jgi:enoyl-CoA hydratase/carnithine racemase
VGVRVEREGRVGVVTLDRPERRNAIDPEMSVAMNRTIVALDEDPDVWAIVVTGAGRVFCAGADLAAIAAGRLREISDAEPGGFGGLVRSTRRTPVVAAVNGHALAGGFELVLACDLAVAVESAEFGLPEVKRGIIAGAGGLIRLPRLIPPRRALELILTGDRIPAREALSLGLLNAVVPDGEALPAALALAQRVCANAPLAVEASLAVVQHVLGAGDPGAWDANQRAWQQVLGTEDAQEGPRAFLEKRPPVWRAR